METYDNDGDLLEEMLREDDGDFFEEMLREAEDSKATMADTAAQTSSTDADPFLAAFEEDTSGADSSAPTRDNHKEGIDHCCKKCQECGEHGKKCEGKKHSQDLDLKAHHVLALRGD